MAKSVKIIPDSKERWSAQGTLRAAAYCRVSTACEEQMGSLEAQQQFFASMIKMHPDWGNVGIFSDQATGLNVAKRPGFQAMLRLCHKGKIDLILTKSFSRLGRNTLDIMKAIRELRRLKVDIYFEKKGIWLHQEEAELLITVYCALSQAESERMSQNIKWGIHRGFQNGTGILIRQLLIVSCFAWLHQRHIRIPTVPIRKICHYVILHRAHVLSCYTIFV